jgi:DNA-3-methyladenine glycosylase
MPPSPTLLDADFFARDTRDVAHDLIGVHLRHGPVSGRIVETEAYRDDAASHWVTRPRTARIMGESHARLYVYRIYGVHLCLNVTTERAHPGAVLIRALEPVDGLATMRRRRAGRPDRELASGPARLVQALGLDASWNGRAFDHGLSWTPAERVPEVSAGPRIGISAARELPWRFMDAGSPHVSHGGARRAARAQA